MASKSSKRFIGLGIIFSIFAIFFALLYYFDFISTMDLFLSVTYVAYFVGIALMYNGAYTREHSKTKATALSFIVGACFILASIGMLIYGLMTGTVILF